MALTFFNIIGFKVEFHGHKNTQKRVPDFYCYSPPIIKDDRVCIIVDCKNQNNYFINTADERAMAEYIENKKAIISQEGISANNLYFLFIGKSFSKDTNVKVFEIARKTNTFGALLSIKTLIYLVEKKLRMGYKFYLENFSKLFKNKEILNSEINYIYKIEDEFIV